MIPLLQGLVRSITWLFLTIFLLLLLTFFSSQFNPIDPALTLVGECASDAAYAQQREQMALDAPFHERFWGYLKNCSQGNLGVSYMTGGKVSEELLSVLPLTFDLATLSLLLSILISLPLGIACAFFHGRPLDRIVSRMTFIGQSAPNFLIGYTIMMLFLACRGPGALMPEYSLFVSLFQGNIDGFLQKIYALWPPAIALTYLSSSYVVRMMRGFILDEKGENYFITAKIKGLSTIKIIMKHLLPNILPRLIPVLAFSYTMLLEGSVVTEVVFALGGLGSFLVRAVLYHDDPAIMGATLLIGFMILSINMFSDMLSILFNPQMRRRS